MKDGCDSWRPPIRGRRQPRRTEDLLLLEIVLTGAAGLTSGEGTLVVPFAGVDTRVPGEMATGRESTIASWADVLLFGGRGSGVRLGLGLSRELRRGLGRIREIGLSSELRVVKLSAHFRGLCARHVVSGERDVVEG